MEASHKAAEPLKPVKPADFVRSMRSEPATEVSEEAAETIAENRAQAAKELAMIFELRDSVAHQWFREQFVDGAYREALAALKSPHTKAEDLADVRATYLALSPIVSGLIVREVAHRELLDPNDQEIIRLREKLDLL